MSKPGDERVSNAHNNTPDSKQLFREQLQGVLLRAARSCAEYRSTYPYAEIVGHLVGASELSDAASEEFEALVDSCPRNAREGSFRKLLRAEMMSAAESAAESGAENPYAHIVGWLQGKCDLIGDNESAFQDLIAAAHAKAREESNGQARK